MRNRLLILLVLGLLAAALAACTSAGAPPAEQTPSIPEATPAVVETPVVVETPAIVRGNEAMVESVELLVMESMPVKVEAVINGYLPDGCTTIAGIASERQGDTFTIHITTQRDILALCTQALVDFSEAVPLDVLGLDAGTYTVNVVGRDGTASASFSLAVDNVPFEEPLSESGALDLPAACLPDDDPDSPNGPFVNLQDGYCFHYPVAAGFSVRDVLSPGIAAVWGPPLTPSFEPIRAGLTVYKREPAGGRALDEFVAAALADNPEAEVVDAGATFAGEAAQVIEGMEGMMDSRRYYLLHNDFVYEITLVPLTSLPEFEEAVMAQREQLWETVSSTFTWLPEEAVEHFAGCPPMEDVGPFPGSPYVNASAGYCLIYPSHYGQQEIPAQAMTIFTGPALDPTVPEPLRSIVTIDVSEAADGRTVQEVVGAMLAVVTGLNIQDSETTLDGEPAILVTGLPARSEGWDLFAVYGDTVYHLRIEPLGVSELAGDLEATWERIIGSFTFLR
jgi:hypothetical protein